MIKLIVYCDFSVKNGGDCMFYGWATKFIFGIIGIGFTRMLAVQIYNGNLTPEKNKILTSPIVEEDFTAKELKKWTFSSVLITFSNL